VRFGKFRVGTHAVTTGGGPPYDALTAPSRQFGRLNRTKSQ
jgi:hypothetical protein